MQEVLQQFFQKYQGWTLYIGFSGGADSLALLLMLHSLQEKGAFQLTAVHCEHGLRGAESRADAAFCREICRKYGIAFLLRTLDVPGNRLAGESDETAARRLRQNAWRELAGHREKTAVVLAHHAGDRRENLLLRLARGSGSCGLSGLRQNCKVSGVRYLRPLLAFERHQLEAFLQCAGETQWREDATNKDTRYRRNFIRQDLLPCWKSAVPGVEKGLDAALGALENEDDFLRAAASGYVAQLLRNGAGLAAWRGIHESLHGRILRLLARKQLGMDWIPGRAFLQAFRAMLEREELGALPLRGVPGGRWIFLEEGGHFEIFEPVEEISRQWHWQWENLEHFQVISAAELPDKISLDEAYFDAAKLPEVLLVSSGKDGDMMIPFGRKNPVLWKKLRVDRQIPRSAAPPLLRLPDGTVLWSPMIRHSAWAPVTPETEKIVGFHWKKGQ